MSTGVLPGIIFAVMCTVLEGGGQVFLKKAAGAKHKLIWTLAGLLGFAAETVLYTLALDKLDVSIAYPIGALSFVVVALLSQWWLGEKVDRTRWAGILLIIAGAGLVAAQA